MATRIPARAQVGGRRGKNSDGVVRKGSLEIAQRAVSRGGGAPMLIVAEESTPKKVSGEESPHGSCERGRRN